MSLLEILHYMECDLDNLNDPHHNYKNKNQRGLVSTRSCRFFLKQA